MNNIYSTVTWGGMDVHYKFSTVTFRDQAGRVVRNRREQMRFHDDLVRLQTAVKSRIHVIFHRHGSFTCSPTCSGPGTSNISRFRRRVRVARRRSNPLVRERASSCTLWSMP